MSAFKLGLLIFLLMNLFIINVSSTSSEGINTKIDIVKNFIDSTSDFTGISAINAPAKLVERLDSLKKLAGVLPILTAIFTVAIPSVAAIRHKEVMAEFQKVHSSISQVREDIDYLDTRIRFENYHTRLFPSFEILRKGLKHLKNNDMVSLRAVCKDRKCLDALETVAHHAPNLAEAFSNTNDVIGDRSKVLSFTGKLIDIVGNSLIMVQGLLEVDDTTNISQMIEVEGMETGFKKTLEETKTKLNRLLPRIAKLLENVMKNGQSKANQQVLEDAITEISPQFNWLDLGFVIYDDNVRGPKHHQAQGHHVEVFQKYGKNALIFYRDVNDKVNEEFADAILQLILSKNQDITRLLTVKGCYQVVTSSKLMKCQPDNRNRNYYASATILKGNPKHSIPESFHSWKFEKANELLVIVLPNSDAHGIVPYNRWEDDLRHHSKAAGKLELHMVFLAILLASLFLQ